MCALHPIGVEDNYCPDFSPAPELQGKEYEGFLGLLAEVEANEEPGEDLRQKEGARFDNKELTLDRSDSFYNGEEIVQSHQHWS